VSRRAQIEEFGVRIIVRRAEAAEDSLAGLGGMEKDIYVVCHVLDSLESLMGSNLLTARVVRRVLRNIPPL
jgi:hypothetical protein